MAQRIITATQIRCHERNRKGPEYDYSVSELPEQRDLIDLLEGWTEDLTKAPDRLRDERRRKYSLVESVDRCNRIITVRGSAGRFGDVRREMDVDTHQVTHTPSAREASTVSLRSMIFVPPTGPHAVIVNERMVGLSIGGPVMDAVRLDFMSLYDDVTFRLDRIVEPEAWLQGVELTSVRGEVWGWSTDAADSGTSVQLGTMTHTIKPDGPAKHLSQSVLGYLYDKKISKAKLLGFPEDQEPDEITVTVEKNGRPKTYVLGKEKTPSMQMQLCGDDENAPSDLQFHEVCEEFVRKDIFPAFGVSWDTRWSRPIGG